MRTLIEPPAARLVAERNSEKAVPILRAMIEDELKNIKDRFGITPKIAEFHRVMIELAGNRTLTMFSNALAGLRSEEHTSELQSLMRTSYAVFCLKKKIT